MARGGTGGGTHIKSYTQATRSLLTNRCEMKYKKKLGPKNILMMPLRKETWNCEISGTKEKGIGLLDRLCCGKCDEVDEHIYGGGNLAMVHTTRRFIVDSVDVNGDFGPPKITEKHWEGRLLRGRSANGCGGGRCLKHWGATPEDCGSASDDQQPAPGGKAGGKVTIGPAQTGLGGL